MVGEGAVWMPHLVSLIIFSSTAADRAFMVNVFVARSGVKRVIAGTREPRYRGQEDPTDGATIWNVSHCRVAIHSSSDPKLPSVFLK